MARPALILVEEKARGIRPSPLSAENHRPVTYERHPAFSISPDPQSHHSPVVENITPRQSSQSKALALDDIPLGLRCIILHPRLVHPIGCGKSHAAYPVVGQKLLGSSFHESKAAVSHRHVVFEILEGFPQFSRLLKALAHASDASPVFSSNVAKRPASAGVIVGICTANPFTTPPKCFVAAVAAFTGLSVASTCRTMAESELVAHDDNAATVERRTKALIKAKGLFMRRALHHKPAPMSNFSSRNQSPPPVPHHASSNLIHSSPYPALSSFGLVPRGGTTLHPRIPALLRLIL